MKHTQKYKCSYVKENKMNILGMNIHLVIGSISLYNTFGHQTTNSHETDLNRSAKTNNFTIDFQ